MPERAYFSFNEHTTFFYVIDIYMRAVTKVNMGIHFLLTYIGRSNFTLLVLLGTHYLPATKKKKKDCYYRGRDTLPTCEI